tara:strand:+ start:92 stop:478 length:387 start_codon:yes stop_codon:yes gene_type:complete
MAEETLQQAEWYQDNGLLYDRDTDVWAETGHEMIHHILQNAKRALESGTDPNTKVGWLKDEGGYYFSNIVGTLSDLLEKDPMSFKLLKLLANYPQFSSGYSVVTEIPEYMGGFCDIEEGFLSLFVEEG